MLSNHNLIPNIEYLKNDEVHKANMPNQMKMAWLARSTRCPQRRYFY